MNSATAAFLRAAACPSMRAQAATGPAQDRPAEKDKYGEANQRGQQARAQTINNLKQIALAMHKVRALNDQSRFPPAAIRTKDGKPLLSWRVAILPFLEQKALYDKFHLDEPWDSPHNKTLLKEMPEVYAPALRVDESRISTYFQVFTGPGALFEDVLGPKLMDIKDGTQNTLMVVEAGSPVPWTKLEDIEYDKKKPLPKLGRQFPDGFHAAFVDGSVLFLRKDLSPDVLRSLITSDGGEIVDKNALRTDAAADLDPSGEPQPQPTRRRDD